MSKRINPFEEITDEQLENTISTLQSYFNFNKQSLVVEKYTKTDPISSIELFILADAIKKCEQINPHWIQKHIKIIEGKNINNVYGSLWEIIFAYILIESGMNVTLEKDSNPGIDLKAIINGLSVNFSLKRFEKSRGLSDIEFFFKKILKTVELYKRQSLTDISIFLHKFPAEDSKQKILGLLKENINSTNAFYENNEKYELFINHNVSYNGIVLEPKCQSYKILLVSELYDNEKKNLYDKISDAFYNLKKYRKPGLNVIAIHINQYAPIDALESFVKDYYINHPGIEIDGVILYQPCLTVNPTDYSITHVIKYIPNEDHIKNIVFTGSIPIFKITIGNLSVNSQCPVLYNGKPLPYNLSEKYTLQYGQLFQKTEENIQYSLNKLGINLNVIPTINNNGRIIGIKGKWLDNDELILI